VSRINAYGLSSENYAKLYGVWKNMLCRCCNKRNERFYTYGKRGITVCKEWCEGFHPFAKWALENGWNPDLWIERKDVNGMYCPANCTFIGRKEQMRNKTNNIRITIEGSERCLAEWCEIFDVPFKTAWMRGRRHGYSDTNLIFYKGDIRDLRRARQKQEVFAT